MAEQFVPFFCLLVLTNEDQIWDAQKLGLPVPAEVWEHIPMSYQEYMRQLGNDSVWKDRLGRTCHYCDDHSEKYQEEYTEKGGSYALKPFRYS